MTPSYADFLRSTQNLLNQADRAQPRFSRKRARLELALRAAQVHATLAVAVAIKEGQASKR